MPTSETVLQRLGQIEQVELDDEATVPVLTEIAPPLKNNLKTAA